MITRAIFTPEHESFRDTVRRFIETEVTPHHADWEKAGQVPRSLWKNAGELGLLCVNAPEAYGGQGADFLYSAILIEEMARVGATGPTFYLHSDIVAPYIVDFGTEAQKTKWLPKMAVGEVVVALGMSEPSGGSDVQNIRTQAIRDGDEYVINGRKWWSSGAGREHCKFSIVMGKTDPEARAHAQQSMVIVPLDTPGITHVRNLSVFGYLDRETHAELLFEDVRVPTSNVLGPEGGGFMMAQARLGPGRIHHCMRLIGMAERALEMGCRRALSREAFRKTIAEQGVVQDWIAESRIAIDQARLLTMDAAWQMDKAGNKAARNAISSIKVVVPRMTCEVIDRVIQIHGGAGVSEDFPLAAMYAGARTLRIADGPDEVHKMVIARRELSRYGE